MVFYTYIIIFYFTLHNYFLLPATDIFNSPDSMPDTSPDSMSQGSMSKKNEDLQRILGSKSSGKNVKKSDSLSLTEEIDKVK